ncbi:MAG: hypothetical protein CMB80_03745 [Flammeovirgaceae bacterium]|nr:hypothetical protein [Flammeovirgaceae bacterium]|tara:strand:- start:647 stop:1657 length:1011 start_codon:yes stop_codon:yes gene_type:complete
MATTITYSGSASKFKQGISVSSFTDMFVSLLPHLSFGNYYALATSGSSSPIGNMFNDQQAGIGSEKLEGPGYHVIVDKRWNPTFYGEVSPEDLDIDVFVDKNAIVSGSSAWLLQQNITSTLSLVDRYQSIVSIGQMDGVIEVFPTRKVIDNTAPVSFLRRPPLSVSLTTMWTDESFAHVGTLAPEAPSPCPLFPITQHIIQDAKLIHPFSDRTNATSGSITLEPQPGQITHLPIFERAQRSSPVHYQNRVIASLIQPFDDITSIQENFNKVFSSKGRGLTVDASMTASLYAMTGNIGQSLFDSKTYGTPAGFTYAISYHTGWRMGTDSLAFGGLKK